MPQTPQAFFDIFLQTPGDFFSFLLIIGFALASLILTNAAWTRFPQVSATRQYHRASGIALGIWLLMLAVAAMSVDGAAPGLMPPLERLAQVLSLAVVAWAFLSADAERWRQRADAGLLLVAALLILFAAYTTQQWLYSAPETNFNAGELAPLWSAVGLALGVVGLAVAFFNLDAIPLAPLKGLCFLIIVVGNGYDLWLFSGGGAAGDFLGSARLTYMAALALMPLVNYQRFIGLADERQAQAEADLAQAQSSTSERQRPDMAEFSQAAAGLFHAADEATLARRIVATVEEWLDAEARLLLPAGDESIATTSVWGRDGEIAPAGDLDLQAALSVGNAPANERTRLGRRLGMRAESGVTIQAMARQHGAAALLIYASRDGLSLSPERAHMLAALTDLAGHALERHAAEATLQASGNKTALARESVPEDEALRTQIGQLTTEHESLLESREAVRRDYDALQERYEARGEVTHQLTARIDDLESQLAGGEAAANEARQHLRDMTDERDNLLRIRDQLTAKLAAATATSASDSDEAALRNELSGLRDKVRTLSADREALQRTLQDRQDTADSGAGQDLRSMTEYAELIRMVNALGDPMAAISACVDMLLAESVGILGAAQLQIVSQASDSLRRLAAMLDDLLRFVQSDATGFALEYAAANMIDLLDAALAQNNDLIRERALAVELSLEDDLPAAAVDSASIERVLAILLRNACLASEQGGDILVSLARGVSAKAGAQVDVLRFRVRDRGGGIEGADMARVFARKYSHAYPKIGGLGVHGVEMSIARAFARANAGDLWIESEAGSGSVFHLELPAALLPSAED